MVLTHARTGYPEYLRAGKDNIIDGLRASSSIPYLTRHAVEIFGEPYFDGGVADALPVQWAAQQSNIKNLLVIRTRTQSYFKASSKADQFFTKYLMNQYAGFSDSLKQRCQRYNATVDFMRQNNQQGILEVCPPDDKMLAGRLCKDKRKLQYTYEVGLESGQKAIEDWSNLHKG